MPTDTDSRALLIAVIAVGLVSVAHADAETSAESTDLTTALSPAQSEGVRNAVDRALDWLVKEQDTDGSFRAANNGQPLTSAFAVMALLSRGHQIGQGRYGESMSSAADYLLSLQDKDGSFAANAAANKGKCHAVIGVALSEVYGGTTGDRAERIRTAIERGLAFSRRVQTRPGTLPHERGGWVYPPFKESRLPATVWEMMFLRSARNSGFQVPQEWVDEGLAFVERCYIPGRENQRTGVFRGTVGARKSHFGRTGMGMLALQLHGRRDSPMVRDGADWLSGHDIPQQGEFSVFYRQCYMCGCAMAQTGGEQWNSFFPRLADRLLPDQHADGYWRLRVKPTNSWGEDNNGNTYHTALVVMTLTLPDQLLPIHQR